MQEKSASGAAVKLGNCRLLVVSGNRFTCQLVRSLLPAIGISSMELSHDLDDARAHLGYAIFDLLIVDAGPAAGIDGLGFVETLRALPDRMQAEAPVVVLMTQPTKEEIERVQRCRVKHVIVKPFSPGALYSHVQRALETPLISSSALRQGFLAEGASDTSGTAETPSKH